MFDLPSLALWQWTIGIVCAFFVGVAKTGVPGLAIFVIPLMVLMVGDARESAGWLLPILSTADLFAVFYWRRHAAVGRLMSLIPWVLGGLTLGAVALALDDRYLRPLIGVIILLMLAVFLIRRRKPDALPIADHAWPYGVMAGFATTIANAAGPVMNLYLLSRKLPKEEFIATGAWFFFVVNLSKVPVYLWYGMFSRQSLSFNAAMIVPVIAGAVTGRWLFQHIPQRLFEILVTVMTVVSTLLLFR